MAARLSLDERVFIESSLGAGRGVADAAQRLGRDPSTVHRELARCAGRAGYDARWAHASACARARRERTPKLAVDRVLAAAVDERLKLRWSPHATAADLREAGMRVCAETIYRACYANDPRSGLPAGAWAKLPRLGRGLGCRRRVGLGGRCGRLSGRGLGRHGRLLCRIDLVGVPRLRNCHSDHGGYDCCTDDAGKNDLPAGSTALARSSLHLGPLRLVPAHPGLHRGRVPLPAKAAHRFRHAQMSEPTCGVPQPTGQ